MPPCLPNCSSSPVLCVFYHPPPFFFFSSPIRPEGFSAFNTGGKEKKKRKEEKDKKEKTTGGGRRTFARGFMSLFNNTSKWLPRCCPEERKRGTTRTADPTSSQGRKHEQVPPRPSPVAPNALR